ncbi:hypothetical protein E8E12_004498 [Didymella heteroderae]|uniref:Uncharacterized protein n=1 Tax=Didymella heteroderae TaxID=1769908 RepID=A0A9P5C4L6_9PLEO|nr:hypothetical protein E8E12_004498 [Didymella heteroderae]
MPYVLVHPLPAPKRNPSKPDLPVFTTSSRAIAHFFYSHGWRVCHVYSEYPPTTSATSSLTSSRSSSKCSSTSTTSLGYIAARQLSVYQPAIDQEATRCCLDRPVSSVLSCGPVVELHCYQITLNAAVFHGPPATAMQRRYLRQYPHPHISFEAKDGDVDLHVPNRAALALRRKEFGEHGVGEKAKDKVWMDIIEEEKSAVWFFEMDQDEEVDEEIDEELGEQWETYERALLASEGLEWAEDGKTLRKKRNM